MINQEKLTLTSLATTTSSSESWLRDESGYHLTWSRSVGSHKTTLDSSRRSRSSTSLVQATFGPYLEETLRFDPASSAPPMQQIRHPERDVFRLHKKVSARESGQNVWFRHEDCKDTDLVDVDDGDDDDDDLIGDESFRLTPLPSPATSSKRFQGSDPLKGLKPSISIISEMTLPPPRGYGPTSQQRSKADGMLPNLPKNNAKRVLSSPCLYHSPIFPGALPLQNPGPMRSVSSRSSYSTSYNQLPLLAAINRYKRPFLTTLIILVAVMMMTFVVLFWNYQENMYRRLTKKQGVILDHWGKGAPSQAETENHAMQME